MQYELSDQAINNNISNINNNISNINKNIKKSNNIDNIEDNLNNSNITNLNTNKNIKIKGNLNKINNKNIKIKSDLNKTNNKKNKDINSIMENRNINTLTKEEKHEEKLRIQKDLGNSVKLCDGKCCFWLSKGRHVLDPINFRKIDNVYIYDDSIIRLYQDINFSNLIQEVYRYKDENDEYIEKYPIDFPKIIRSIIVI